VHFLLLWHASAFPTRTIEPRMPHKISVGTFLIIRCFSLINWRRSSLTSRLPIDATLELGNLWRFPQGRVNNPAGYFKPLALFGCHDCCRDNDRAHEVSRSNRFCDALSTCWDGSAALIIGNWAEGGRQQAVE
jgi:hypothetical protein